jgi:hypothetical protein
MREKVPGASIIQKNVSQEIIHKKRISEQVFPLETDIKISNCTISI